MDHQPPDTPELVDPNAAISSLRCDFCGEPETTARPLDAWHFSMEDGHWHIRACPSCAHDRLGPFLNEASGLMPGSVMDWKSRFLTFVHQFGTKSRVE